MNRALLDEFRLRLGSKNVLEASEISQRYCCDWSGINPFPPLAVLKPRDVNDVAFIMEKCHQNSQAVVVQGGLTGLCSGATPQPNEVALSLERLSGIEEIDQKSMTMTVLAGTPLQLIQQSANAQGLWFPLDLGARGSCTIGGNIATNAGGTEVIQFGMTRSLILGIEVVLPDGTIISSLNKMLKNNAGFDLKHLFIGTEGLLGIVTRAVLRLFPAALTRSTALCAVNDIQDCIQLLRHLRRKLGSSLSSFEVMWPDYIQYALKNLNGLSFPFESTSTLCALVEHTGTQPDTDSDIFESTLHEVMASGLVVDAVIAQSERDAANIWCLREAIGEIFQKLNNAISFDISVPIGSIQTLLEQVTDDLQEAFLDITKLTYGHLGDSNIHLTITTNSQDDQTKISDIVYHRVGNLHGSISGEHGIGILKRKYLPLSRSSAEINLMQSLKTLIDPKGILNPNRVLP